jgi:hypothetical protein
MWAVHPPGGSGRQLDSTFQLGFQVASGGDDCHSDRLLMLLTGRSVAGLPGKPNLVAQRFWDFVPVPATDEASYINDTAAIIDRTEARLLQ